MKPAGSVPFTGCANIDGCIGAIDAASNVSGGVVAPSSESRSAYSGLLIALVV